MYLDNKNCCSIKRKSSAEASSRQEARPSAQVPSVLIRHRSGVLFSLLALGLFGDTSAALAQAPAQVTKVSCPTATLVGSGTLSCSVTLSAPAPAGGLTVQLTSGSSALSVPASVVVEPGKSSAVFSATGSPVSAPEGATLTAVAGTGHVGTAVSLLSSTSPVQVIAENSGKCLDVRAFSMDAGAAVQQWSCTGGANQQWLFIAAADGSYQVQSVNSGMSLNIDGDSMSNGAPVIQWPYSSTPNENWQLEPTGDGYYTLVVESTGKCLDVNGGPSATGDGIVVQQWDCWGGSNQAWQLVSNSGVTHSVTLTWNPSTSSNVAGYYVYRGSTSGGPYTKLSSLLSSDSYVDGSVQVGQTFFYVTTAADSSGDESAYSNEVQATIPSP